MSMNQCDLRIPLAWYSFFYTFYRYFRQNGYLSLRTNRLGMIIMHLGVDEHGEWVRSHHVLAGQRVYCPKCGQPMQIKTSKLGKCFFAHRYSCGSEKPINMKYSQGESHSHKAFKTWIMEKLQHQAYQILSEYPINGEAQVADILIQHLSHQLIIEYQQSKISHHVLFQRHQGYLRQSIPAIWIGSEQVIENLESKRWLEALIQYDVEWGFFILTWDSLSQQLYLRSHLSIIYHMSQVKQGAKIISVEAVIDKFLHQHSYSKLLDVKGWNLGVDKRMPLDIDEKIHQRKLQQYKHQKSLRPWMNVLYQLGQTIDHIPQNILCMTDHLLTLEVPIWLGWAFIKYWFQQFSQGCQVITVEDVRYCMLKFRDSQVLPISPLPLIHGDMTTYMSQALWQIFQKDFKGSSPFKLDTHNFL